MTGVMIIGQRESRRGIINKESHIEEVINYNLNHNSFKNTEENPIQEAEAEATKGEEADQAQANTVAEAIIENDLNVVQNLFTWEFK